MFDVDSADAPAAGGASASGFHRYEGGGGASAPAESLFIHSSASMFILLTNDHQAIRSNSYLLLSKLQDIKHFLHFPQFSQISDLQNLLCEAFPRPAPPSSSPPEREELDSGQSVGMRSDGERLRAAFPFTAL